MKNVKTTLLVARTALSSFLPVTEIEHFCDAFVFLAASVTDNFGMQF